MRAMALLLSALMPAGLMPAALVSVALVVVARTLLLRDGLIHQVEHTEIMLSVLKIALGHHAITAARRIPPQLQIFLKQLLGRAADPDIGAIAVEYVVPVERNTSARMMAHTSATTATTTTTSSATAARALVTATHAFHVHSAAVVLSRCGAA